MLTQPHADHLQEHTANNKQFHKRVWNPSKRSSTTCVQQQEKAALLHTRHKAKLQGVHAFNQKSWQASS